MKKTLILFAAGISFATEISAQVPSYVPTSSLVSWYGFNGNAVDAGPAANSTTVHGATLTTDRFAVANKAYSFDGISNYISAGTVTAYNSDNFSISFWVNRNSDPGTRNLISCGGNNSNLWGAIGGQSALTLRVGDMCLGSGTTLLYNTSGPWHMITYCQSGTVQTIYHDAVNEGTVANTVMSSVTCDHDSLYIGVAWAGFAQYFDGKLDDIGIWNRVLNDCEVEKLYFSGINPIVAATSNTMICAGQGSTLTANGGTTYVWNPGNLTGSVVAVTPTLTTTYTCVGASTISNCSYTTLLTQNVTTCTAIENNELIFSHISIFPNPSQNGFYISAEKEMQLVIVNELGQEVKKVFLEANARNISVGGLKPGIYFIRENSSGIFVKEKIVVME
jgi:hypothetical protein